MRGKGSWDVSPAPADTLRDCKRVSGEVVVRLGAAFEDAPEVWLRAQAAYDAWHLSRNIDVSKVPRFAA